MIIILVFVITICISGIIIILCIYKDIINHHPNASF